MPPGSVHDETEEAALDALRKFLIGAFDSAGLREFIRFGPKGTDLEEDLPDEVSRARLVSAIVLALKDEGMLTDPALFFDRLAVARNFRAPEVHAIQAMFTRLAERKRTLLMAAVSDDTPAIPDDTSLVPNSTPLLPDKTPSVVVRLPPAPEKKTSRPGPPPAPGKTPPTHWVKWLIGLVVLGAAMAAVLRPGECGDGAYQEGEQCDDGNKKGGDGCSADCRAEPLCGDNDKTAGEQCDDGNKTNGDGCSSDCFIEVKPVCGDKNTTSDEQCDDGNKTNGDGCSSDCLIEIKPVCGDKSTTADEQCDDGNKTDGDGCSTKCLIETKPVCGDKSTTVGEQCDDGNKTDGDGCSSKCLIEIKAVCGDGKKAGDEECDDGKKTSTCTSRCRRPTLRAQFEVKKKAILQACHQGDTGGRKMSVDIVLTVDAAASKKVEASTRLRSHVVDSARMECIKNKLEESLFLPCKSDCKVLYTFVFLP